MEDLLDGHRRSLAAMREAYARNPRPHANQLAALERELELAAGGDLEQALRAGGGLFELARGAWLDRLGNAARVAAAVGDVWTVRAAAAEQAHALRATGHADWAAHLAAGAQEAAALHSRGADARGAFVRLLLGATAIEATADAEALEELYMHTASALAALREADPAFAWSRLEAQPRYGLRVPWTGDARALVGEWIDALDDGEPPAEEEAGDPLGAIEAAAAEWRAGLAGRTGAPWTGALEGAAPAVPGLDDAPLRARVAEGLARQAIWPEPLVERHWRALDAALDAARTPTEVELAAVHAQACLDVEADWNGALLGALLAPLRAAAAEGAAGLQRAAVAAAFLTGLAPHALVALPRVQAFVRECLLPHALRDPGPIGAVAGEAGFDAVTAVREHLAETGLRPAGPDALCEHLLDAAPEIHTTGPRPVALWGRTIALADLADAATWPPRPIPGAAAGL